MRMHENRNIEENVAALLSTIDRLAVAPDREFLQQLRERSAREFQAAAPDRVLSAPKTIRITALGSMIMRSPITKVAIAAVILIACVIGVSLWRVTGSGIALADVLARLEQIKAFQCKGSVTMAGEMAPGKSFQWETRYTCLTSQDYGVRVRVEQADPNGRLTLFGETYLYPQKKTLIRVGHAEKKYIRSELDDVDVHRMQEELGRYSDPRAFLKEIMACRYESLGRSTIESVEVEGFRTTDPNCRGGATGIKDPQVDIKVWIDVKTRLPVRYESFTSGLNERGSKTSFRFVMHDFRWDISVDTLTFEAPPVPEGYIVVVEKSLGPLNEQTVIESLRQCVQLLGKYPGTVGVALPAGLQMELGKSDSPAAVRLKEELKELTEQERVNRLMDAGTPLRRLSEFYVRLIGDRKDPAYYGKTITPKDAEKVLMRWRVSNTEYRIIFGDLHTETVSREKLAELEKAQPK